jgi:hypothetical protein
MNSDQPTADDELRAKREHCAKLGCPAYTCLGNCGFHVDRSTKLPAPMSTEPCPLTEHTARCLRVAAGL